MEDVEKKARELLKIVGKYMIPSWVVPFIKDLQSNGFQLSDINGLFSILVDDKDKLTVLVHQTGKITKMNINQGLKDKNRLAGKIRNIDEKIRQNSSWLKGNQPAYDVNELLKERENVVKELNELKVKISNATQPVVTKIIEMSELKSLVSVLKGMDVKRGFHNDHYSRMAQAVPEYESVMSSKDKDKLVEGYEAKIGTLQDELDSFNATTSI